MRSSYSRQATETEDSNAKERRNTREGESSLFSRLVLGEATRVHRHAIVRRARHVAVRGRHPSTAPACAAAALVLVQALLEKHADERMTVKDCERDFRVHQLILDPTRFDRFAV